jgi:hypothetical protein
MLFAAGSPVGDVVGKLTVGYQGWFACSNDLSPLTTKWKHWVTNSALSPRPSNVHFDLYPDVREYTTTYQTGFANLGNGSPAKLFSSYDTQVINKHVEWMQTYGIDTIALQRFGSTLTDTNTKAFKDGIATKIKNAAQTYGRKFFIMYDISDWTNFQTEMKTDWTNTITGTLALTNSSAYAKQNGKPVVCIWGIGCDGRPGNNTSWNDVINFMKGKNCYVIMGVKRTWATNTISCYTNGNMISPWSVSGFTNNAGADSYATQMGTERTTCNNRGQDFLPVVWPGFSWANWNPDSAQNKTPRYHGDFMWRQFYNVRNQNIPSVYVAMFDEYDEGTAIAKAAENSSMKPTDKWFLTLDADGTACSSDFYLRLTGDGAQMVKSNATKVTTHPTPHTVASGTTVTFYSVGAHDGYVDESSETSNIGGTNSATANTGTALRAGDTGAKKQRKSIVSFDTSSLPDACTITAATLKLKRGGGIGTPTSLGSLCADIKNAAAGFGTSINLENTDFEAAATASAVATLSYPATTNAWSTGSLNSSGLSAVNKTGHTQFKVRFATDDDNDTADDYLGFYSGENASTTNKPVLEVTYQ